MRRVFRDKRIWERAQSGELAVVAGPIKLRKNPSVAATAPYNQEIIIVDPSSNTEIARCHRFLESDKVTPGASGLPDPKEIYIDGVNYHQLGKKEPDCEHCRQGISTYSEPTAVPE